MAANREKLWEMYERLGLDMALFGISSECPYDGRKVCPIKEIKELKGLDLGERFMTIKRMDNNKKREIIEKTIDCALICQSTAA